MRAIVDKAKRVNWVVHMHNCTMPKVLDAVFEQASVDISERQKLNDLPDGIDFVIDDRRARDLEFEVRRVSTCQGCEDPAVVERVKFSCAVKSGLISVTMSGKEMKITRQWNDETVNCDYYLDRKPVALWQISKATLTDILFW